MLRDWCDITKRKTKKSLLKIVFYAVGLIEKPCPHQIQRLRARLQSVFLEPVLLKLQTFSLVCS